MSWPLIVACLWALAATATALLPMRFQIFPGLALLVLAPVLIGWIGRDHGIWLALVAVLGFASMFRRPLWHLGRRVLGRPVSGRGRPG